MCDEFDLEDLESMLYSQVYHVSSENQENTDAINSNNNGNNDVTGFQDKFSTNHITLKSKRQNNRYFHAEKDNLRNSSIYISIEQNGKSQHEPNRTPDTPFNAVENAVPVETNGGRLMATDNFVGQFQNNITINQYNIPVVINSETEGTDKVSNRYKRFLERKKKKQEKLKTKRKKVANKEKRKKNSKGNMSCLIVELNENTEGQANNVICLSDDSNSECVIVQDTESLDKEVTKKVSTGFPKKYNENDKFDKEPESDDDIIYIPPPPVEVITIDVEELKEREQKDTPVVNNQKENQTTEESRCEVPLSNVAATSHGILDSSSKFPKPSNEKYNPKERKELICTPDSSASNDFLENATIENSTEKFNFSLHGSDFNSASADFVVPAKPVETCETESSCSTNDLNRDFNNSVKSLVFNEVEFPRTDIFSENNLESFGNYITPKRDAIGNPGIAKKSTGKAKSKKLDLDTSSASSSSESDYEPGDNVKSLKDLQKLPNLSPMQVSETVVRKKKLKKTSSEFFKKQENQGENVSNKRKKNLYKRKSDAVEISETETDSDNSVKVIADAKKKQIKKKQKPVNTEDVIQVSKKKKTTLKEATHANCEKKKKSKNSDCELNKSQTKKKKSTSDMIISSGESEEQSTNAESGRKKKSKNTDYILNKSQSKKKSFSDISNSGEESTGLKKPKKVQVHFQTPEIEKSKKHFSDSKITEHNDNMDAETSVKKKKKKKSSLESKYPPENDEHQQIAITEKDKKRRTMSKESENEDVQEMKSKRKKSCSTSSNKSLDVVVDVSDIDEYIEIELLDEDHEELCNINRNNAHDLEVVSNKVPDEGSSLPQDNASLEETKKEIVSAIVETISEHNVYSRTTETSCHFATITQTPAEQREEHDSDEEIIVDEFDSILSNLIVVDEVNCTIDEEEIKVVSSSESDFDFRDLTDVGNNIQLVNCSSNLHQTNRSEEIIVVDDNVVDRHSFRDNSSEFDMVAIHSSQTDDPQSWKISHKDRILPFNSDRTRGPRCNRCRQYGHNATRCIEKRGSLKCSLCGDSGHQEPRCTKKICTQCGNQGDYSTTYCWKCFKFRNSICRICNMRGHIAKMCPDLWRRYYLTTEEGPIVVPQRAQSEPLLQWCSGCTQQGHLEHDCNYVERQYPPMSPLIISYEDVLVPGDLSSLRTEDAPAPLEGVFGPQVITDVQPSTSTNESDVQITAGSSLNQIPSSTEMSIKIKNNSYSNIPAQDTNNKTVSPNLNPQDADVIIISSYLISEETGISKVSSNINSQSQNVAGISSSLIPQDRIVASIDLTSTDQDESVANIFSNLTYQDTNVASVSSDVTSQDTNIATVSSDITDQDTNVANVSSIKTYQDTKVASVSSDKTSKDTNVASVSSNITYQDTIVASIDLTLTDQDEGVENISSNLTYQDTNVASVSSDITAQDTNIATVSSDITDQDTNVANVSSIKTYQDTKVASVSSDKTSKDTNVASVSSNITYQDTIVASIDLTLTDQDEGVENISSNLTYQDTNVASVSSDITSQDTTIATVSSDMTHPDTNVANVSSIKTYQDTNVASVSSDQTSKGTNVASASSNITYQDTNVASVSSNLTCQITSVASVSPNLTCRDTIVGFSSKLTSQDTKITGVSSTLTYQNTTTGRVCSNLTSQDMDVASVSSLSPQDTKVAISPNSSTRILPSPIEISLISSSESSADSSEDLSSDEEGNDSVQNRDINPSNLTKNKDSTIGSCESLEIVNVTSPIDTDSANQSNAPEQELLAVNLSSIRRQDPHINITIMIRCMARENQYKMRRMLMRQPEKFRENLEKDMNELQALRRVTNVEYFKQLLSKFNQLKKGTELVTMETLEEQCFWLRIMNMFVFGLHGYGHGKYHMSVLRNYLENTADDTSSKRSLLMSYDYIFGIRKHKGTNYSNMISKILSKLETDKETFVIGQEKTESNVDVK